MGFNCLKATEPPHHKETVYFLSLSPQEVLILIWSIFKAEPTLGQPSGFEPWTPGLGIQHPNH